ncbi:helix-turn-helix domain-containing protein [Actinoplanes sp. CA-054009]
MEAFAGSTVPRRTLGLGLRQAREAAGIKLKDAAAALDVSTQTMWRIENGTTSTRTADVLHLCTLYGVSDKMRDAFLGLARETKSKGWWHAYGDVVPAWFELYVGLEQAAATIRTYAPSLVPGLLQSREYMGSAIRADDPELSDDDVSTRIRLKQNRQQLLTRAFPEPPRIEAIISEAVFLAEPKPEGSMRSQVWHLLKATELDNISIRILPTARGPHRASVAGAFTLLDFRRDNGNTPPATVYAENLTGAIYLDKPSEINVYAQVCESIASKALNEQASIDFLSSVLKELNDRES